jgi:hypothetical protein
VAGAVDAAFFEAALHKANTLPPLREWVMTQ